MGFPAYHGGICSPGAKTVRLDRWVLVPDTACGGIIKIKKSCKIAKTPTFARIELAIGWDLSCTLALNSGAEKGVNFPVRYGGNCWT